MGHNESIEADWMIFLFRKKNKSLTTKQSIFGDYCRPCCLVTIRPNLDHFDELESYFTILIDSDYYFVPTCSNYVCIHFIFS